jgi:hypothetical protein
MQSTKLLRPSLAASERAADAIHQNPEADNATESAMNKAKIIAELENMVAARLFSSQPWITDDQETISACHRKLVQMCLVEQDTWRTTPLGKELDVDLFRVFMGLWYEYDVPIILEEYGLFDESDFDDMIESEADAETLLSGYVRRAYFDYRKRR